MSVRYVLELVRVKADSFLHSADQHGVGADIKQDRCKCLLRVFTTL